MYAKFTTVRINYSISLDYYAFPTGSVYGFGMKPPEDVSYLRIRKQSQISAYTDIVNKAGLFHILFGLNKF